MSAYSPDWAVARRRVATHDWAAGVLSAVGADFGYWAGLRVPGPDRPSAWTHHYFCDDDGTELLFDPALPGRHTCSRCGRGYTGEPWDGAWRAIAHNAAAAQAQRAALLLRLGDPARRPAARAELERILSAYARDYLSYEAHGVNAGKGRVQPQCLDEAVWAVGLLRALRWAGDVLDPATSRAVDGMAGAIVDLLRPQVGMVHNIHCWLLAALAECAARLGDTELLAWCRDSEFGAEAQVGKGFHAEGLWYEINPHYHYYAVAALLSYREAAGPRGLTKESAVRLSRAVTAPPMLAYADGRLPAYGDGWAGCFTADFAPQAEAAWTILPEEPADVAPYYAHPRPEPVRLWFGAQLPRGAAPELPGRSSVAALLFGPGDVGPVRGGEPPSFVWPRAGIGLLRSSGVRLAMRFGPDAGWHDHLDKLNVDARTSGGWSSLDLGTSGYGSGFTAWLRSPVAHNVVIVGGRPQPRHTGRLLAASARHLSAESAWEGHVLRRTVSLTPDGWTDSFAVALARPGPLEWVFHGDGRFAPEPAGTAVPAGSPGPAESAQPAGSLPAPGGEAGFLDDGLGHAWLREVRPVALPPDRVLRGSWDAAGAPRLVMRIPAGFGAFTAVADGNPDGRPLGLILVRGQAREARFHAAFRLPADAQGGLPAGRLQEAAEG